MTTNVQISAFISEETKTQVERFVASRGIKKAFLIETALLHHLQALREIPEDVMIPARLVLGSDSLERVADRLASDERPTDALKSLFEDQR